MSYKFLVYIDAKTQTTDLCEGGVYTDDLEILLKAKDYKENNFARGQEDVDINNTHSDQNYGTYRLVDSFEMSLADLDLDVLSSLADWQKSALKVQLVE
jgi:hypothetical protein